MAKPIPVTTEDHLRAISHRLDALGMHTHPGAVVATGSPTSITGSRTSNVASILDQILDVLAASGLITNDTTG